MIEFTKDFYVIFMNDGGFPALIEVETLEKAYELVRSTYSQHYLIQDRINNLRIAQSD